MKATVQHIIFFLAITISLLPASLNAQVVDTVCKSHPYGRYGVMGSQGSLYFWTVSGGQITQTNGADSIEVEWDFTQPHFSLQVVELSASGCMGDTVKASVAKGQDPIISIQGSDSICSGQYTILTAQGGTQYLWSTGDSTASITPLIQKDTSFVLIGSDGCGMDTAQWDVFALPLPLVDFQVSPNTLIENQKAVFTYSGSGAVSFEWYVDNSALNKDHSIVDHIFGQSGHHEVALTAYNEYLCYDTLSKILYVQMGRTNSFTPNGDGVNDWWEIRELENFPDCKVWIYDRSGAEVFYSEGYPEPWDGTRDGKTLPIGSYYYIIDYGDGQNAVKGIINILK